MHSPSNHCFDDSVAHCTMQSALVRRLKPRGALANVGQGVTGPAAAAQHERAPCSTSAAPCSTSAAPSPDLPTCIQNPRFISSSLAPQPSSRPVYMVPAIPSVGCAQHEALGQVMSQPAGQYNPLNAPSIFQYPIAATVSTSLSAPSTVPQTVLSAHAPTLNWSSDFSNASSSPSDHSSSTSSSGNEDDYQLLLSAAAAAASLTGSFNDEPFFTDRSWSPSDALHRSSTPSSSFPPASEYPTSHGASWSAQAKASPSYGLHPSSATSPVRTPPGSATGPAVPGPSSIGTDRNGDDWCRVEGRSGGSASGGGDASGGMARPSAFSSAPALSDVERALQWDLPRPLPRGAKDRLKALLDKGVSDYAG